MSKLRKTLSILVAVALVVTLLTPAAFAADNKVQRVAGENRYETSADIALDKFDSADTVIIVNGEDRFAYADGLAASVLAGALDAPILLTDANELSDAVADAIEELGASKAYILGGTTAVSEAVEEALEDLDLDITRLDGENRYETAALIAEEADTDSKTAYVVNGWANADAMVAGAAAFNNGNPILLVAANEIPEVTAEALDELGIEEVVIVGGTAVVSKAVADELDKDYDVKRIAGEGRYETSAVFAEETFNNPAGVSIVNGWRLADAIGASVYGNPILYANANGNVLDKPVEEYLDELLEANENLAVTLFGGPVALSNALQNAIQNKIDGAEPEELKVVSVTALNAKQVEIKFNNEIDKDSVIQPGSNNLQTGLVEFTRIPAAPGADDRNVTTTALGKLSSDKKTLIITAAGTEYFDGTYTLYIADGIVDVNGEALGRYNTSFSIKDETAPTVKEVKYDEATDQIVVTMSEPVKVAPSIRLDNGSPVASTANAFNDEFRVSHSASKGEKVKVSVAGAIDFNDNVQSSAYTTDVEIKHDETAVNVTSISQQSSNVIRVVFNKAIQGGSNASVAEGIVQSAITNVLRGGVSLTVDKVERKDSVDKSLRTFDITLEDGTGPDYDKIYPNKATSATVTIVFAEDALRDVFGNTNEEITKTITMKRDAAGPVIVNTRISTNKENIVIRFDEDVKNGTSPNIGDITVRQDGLDVSSDFSAVLTGDRTLELQYGSEIPNGNYAIRIPEGAILDLHGNKIKLTNITVKVTNSSTAETEVLSITDNGNNQYEVAFNNPVGNSALDAKNYALNGVALTGEQADIYFKAGSDKKIVVIKLENKEFNYEDNSATLRVLNVLDTNGNKVKHPTSVSGTVSIVDYVKPTLKSVRLDTNSNVLTFTFDEEIQLHDGTSPATWSDLDDLVAHFEIKGGNIKLNAGTTSKITANVNGKNLVVVVTDPGDSNWNTVKASSKITVKTLEPATPEVRDVNSQANVMKKDTTVDVTKTSN